VALLWRPHPLIKATIESMRPQLWEVYDKIVEAYRNEGWGIYDDTTDMDRAVILSDAYYGDRSSVVQLYQKTGKPMLIQNVAALNPLSSYDILPLSFENIVKDGNDIWFSANECNGLYKMNLATGEMIELGEFPNESKSRSRLYRDISRVDHLLFFAPTSADEIAAYDLVNEKFYKWPFYFVDIPEGELKSKFVKCEVYGDHVYFFGYTPNIIALNINTGKCRKCDNSEQILDSIRIQGGKFSTYPIRTNHNMIINIRHTNKVLMFDFDTEKSVIKTIGKNDYKLFSGVCADDKILFFGENIVLAVDLEMKEYSILYDCDSEIQDRRFWMAYYIQGNAFIFDGWTNDVLKINIHTKEFHIIPLYEDEKFEYTRENVVRLLWKDSKNILLFDERNHSIKKFNPEMEEISSQKAYIERKRFYEKTLADDCRKEGERQPGEELDLSNVLDLWLSRIIN
jgi:hypothetical protein